MSNSLRSGDRNLNLCGMAYYIDLYFCVTLRGVSYWFSSVFCLFVLSQRAKLNLPALQAAARLRTDPKATKTITMTIAAYFFSYVPVIVYEVVGNKEKVQADSWFGFFACYAVSFSSAVNEPAAFAQHSANSLMIPSDQTTSKRSQVVG